MCVPGWDSEQDVVVVGSGAAALVAAISAHDHGARVRVVERCDVLGGTSAVSGGGMWVPLHHRSRDGEVDTRERVLEYVRGMSLGRTDDARLIHFVDNAAILKSGQTRTRGVGGGAHGRRT